jgi:hypothetical protein
MKRLSLFFAGLFLLLLSLHVKAQTSTADYFTGKWNVVVKGTPNGDARMFVVLEKKDTTLTGTIQDSTGTEMSKIDSVTLSDTSATVFFNAQGYDVNLVMNKKDDDHITGNMMGMFDADGERVK